MRSVVTQELVDIFTKLGDKILQISNYKLKLNIFNIQASGSLNPRLEAELGNNAVKAKSKNKHNGGEISPSSLHTLQPPLSSLHTLQSPSTPLTGVPH